MCFQTPLVSAPDTLRRSLVSQPAVKVPSALAWNMKLPQPGPALWFQLASELQFIQYSMVAWSSLPPNTSGMLKPAFCRLM